LSQLGDYINLVVTLVKMIQLIIAIKNLFNLKEKGDGIMKIINFMETINLLAD